MLAAALLLLSPALTAQEQTAETVAPALAEEPVNSEAAAAELAKKLANPISSLISVPIQFNYDENIGPRDKGSISKVTVQPVIPMPLNDDWNVISRTIVPFLWQNDLAPTVDDEAGLGDITQSFFFSPKEPTSGGLVWGVGPVLLFPTATDDQLGGEKWGAGPTAVGLVQRGPWTAGLLANHIWSFAGEDDRDDVNATFVQPFLSYITKTKTTFGLASESTYNWETDEWSVPINATVSQLLKLGSMPVQISGGVRYWAESPENGPEDWGFRLQMTLLFPTR
jgi:hypothetical protein